MSRFRFAHRVPCTRAPVFKLRCWGPLVVPSLKLALSLGACRGCLAKGTMEEVTPTVTRKADQIGTGNGPEWRGIAQAQVPCGSGCEMAPCPKPHARHPLSDGFVWNAPPNGPHSPSPCAGHPLWGRFNPKWPSKWQGPKCGKKNQTTQTGYK